MKSKEGDLRIWYAHQVGSGGVFYKPVASPDEAKTALATIYELAVFMYDNNMITDYANSGGLEVYESDGEGDFEWCEWQDDDGFSIDELMSE